MTGLAFDTSVLIGIEKKEKYILQKISELSKIYPLIPKLPFISHFEYTFGLKKRKPKKTGDLLRTLNKFQMLPVTEKTSDILSDLKIKYDDAGISLSLAFFFLIRRCIQNAR